jgi:hypothetical protein
MRRPPRLGEDVGVRRLLVLGVAVLLAAGACANEPVPDQDAGPPLGPTLPPAASSTVAPLAPSDIPSLPPGPPPGAAPTARCVPYKEPTSIADVEATVTGYPSVDSFRGGDVGADVLLADGRRLWVFGDTMRSDDKGGVTYVRNSMLVFGNGCASVVTPADQGALIPNRPDGVGYWPMSIAKISLAGYDLVGVMVQRVRGTPAVGGFEILGSSVAVFRVETGGVPTLLAVRDLDADSADATKVVWGAASYVDIDGWAYVYGTANPRLPYVFGYSLLVARMRPTDVINPSAWTYWDGSSWQFDRTRAATLIPAAEGVSQTLSVFRSGWHWYAISKRDDFIGTDLVIWSSPTATGPFTPNPPSEYIPSDPANHIFRYMALAHPDLLPTPGKVVVSVSQNSDDLQLLARDPLLYRPRFYEITLPSG